MIQLVKKIKNYTLVTSYCYTIKKKLQLTELSGEAKFCVKTFYVIVNKINNELEKRQQSY